MSEENRLIVITGGPGVGKTTLLNVLEGRGHSVIPESAKILIELGQQNDSDCLPWRDIKKFQLKVIDSQIKFESQTKEGIHFLDRGIIDSYAYSRLAGIDLPVDLESMGRNRYDVVFLIDPLKSYENNSYRKESPEEARKIHDEIGRAYELFGYKPIRVPDIGPEKRADFILDKIGGLN